MTAWVQHGSGELSRDSDILVDGDVRRRTARWCVFGKEAIVSETTVGESGP